MHIKDVPDMDNLDTKRKWLACCGLIGAIAFMLLAIAIGLLLSP